MPLEPSQLHVLIEENQLLEAVMALVRCRDEPPPQWALDAVLLGMWGASALFGAGRGRVRRFTPS